MCVNTARQRSATRAVGSGGFLASIGKPSALASQPPGLGSSEGWCPVEPLVWGPVRGAPEQDHWSHEPPLPQQGAPSLVYHHSLRLARQKRDEERPQAPQPAREMNECRTATSSALKSDETPSPVWPSLPESLNVPARSPWRGAAGFTGASIAPQVAAGRVRQRPQHAVRPLGVLLQPDQNREPADAPYRSASPGPRAGGRRRRESRDRPPGAGDTAHVTKAAPCAPPRDSDAPASPGRPLVREILRDVGQAASTKMQQGAVRWATQGRQM